jgi:hypothetical protein
MSGWGKEDDLAEDVGRVCLEGAVRVGEGVSIGARLLRRLSPSRAIRDHWVGWRGGRKLVDICYLPFGCVAEGDDLHCCTKVSRWTTKEMMLEKPVS